MKTISALLVIEKKHYSDISTQLQNLHFFDKIYLFFNGVDEELDIRIDSIANRNINYIKSDTLVSTDSAYKKLLNMCETDYFTLLSPNHFHHGEIAKYIKVEAEHDYDLIYVDEGYIENEGQSNMKVYYYNKPSFDKELLYCQNYISRGAFYKTSLAKTIDAFSNDLRYNSDWEFSLAFTENTNCLSIKHIPISLIAIKNDDLSNSKISFISDKSDTSEVDKFISLLKNHIKKTNRDSDIYLSNDGYFRILFKPLDNPKVVIVIPTKDKLDLLKPCIESIISKTTYKNYGIIVIDNNSAEEETIQYLNDINKIENITVLKYLDEFDYSKIHNTIVEYIVNETDYRYMCMLNNDTEVINPDWLTDMVGIASDPTVGAVGGKLIYADNTIQHAGVVIGICGLANHLYHSQPSTDKGYWNGLELHRNCSAVTGACLLLSLDHYKRVGGMWEMLPIAYNDVDLCLSLLKLNLRNIWSPNALLYHYESKSRGQEDNPEKLRRFARDHIYMRYKHGKLINNDPYYNENFDCNKVNFSTGSCSPLRHKYSNKEYLLDVPYGLEFVMPTWLPMPAGSKFNFAIRLPLKLKAKLKGLVLPFHQQELVGVNMGAKFHATIRFPDDTTAYELESISNNGKNVRFNFTGFERDVGNIDVVIISMYVVETTSSIHLKWFYSENQHSQAFESMSERQFRLIMILEDL